MLYPNLEAYVSQWWAKNGKIVKVINIVCTNGLNFFQILAHCGKMGSLLSSPTLVFSKI